jgi:hypothetical protein
MIEVDGKRVPPSQPPLELDVPPPAPDVVTEPAVAPDALPDEAPELAAAPLVLPEAPELATVVFDAAPELPPLEDPEPETDEEFPPEFEEHAPARTAARTTKTVRMVRMLPATLDLVTSS